VKHSFDDGLAVLAERRIKLGMQDRFLDYTVKNLNISRSAAGTIEFDIPSTLRAPTTYGSAKSGCRQKRIRPVWDSAPINHLRKVATEHRLRRAGHLAPS
jgi:hypothetical protein